MSDHSRRGFKFTLIVILIAGAFVVFFVSIRSMVQTFSTSIRPVAIQPPQTFSPSGSVGTPATEQQSQQLLESLFGNGVDPKKNQAVIDAKTLRNMLSVQGINSTLIQSLSDDDLMRLYTEFTSSIQTPPEKAPAQ